MNARKQKYLITIGFISLFIGVLLAYRFPAEDYELSIYRSTPFSYWAIISFVILISIIISFTTEKKSLLTYSLVIASLSILSVIALPLIRGYYYLGMSDSVSHLARTTLILEGTVNPFEEFYPAIHIIGSYISLVTGLSPRISLILILPVLGAVFIFFIPLTLNTIHRKFDYKLTIIGTFSALFFLPINNIGTHFQPHPSSQSLLFLPAVIYLYFKYEETRDNRLLTLFTLFYFSLILFHPQQAMALFFLLLIIVFFDKTINYKISFDFSLRTPILTGIIFWVWAGYQAKFEAAIEGVIPSLFLGSRAPARDVSQRAMALVEIGGSTEELFIKIFGVTAIFILLTLIFIIKRKKTFPSDRKIITYLFLGVIPISIIASIYILIGVGGGQTQRYVGFIQVIFTITGAYSFFYLVKDVSKPKRESIIIIFICLGLLISSLIYFPAPFIYQGNSHVTEGHYQGYDTAFTTYNESLELGSIRMHPDRFYATTQRVSRPSGAERREFRADPPDHFNNQSLHTYYERPSYLAITESEKVRDAELYQGFRYSWDDFEYLERDPHIDKVYNNGDFELYLVNS